MRHCLKHCVGRQITVTVAPGVASSTAMPSIATTRICPVPVAPMRLRADRGFDVIWWTDQFGAGSEHDGRAVREHDLRP